MEDKNYEVEIQYIDFKDIFLLSDMHFGVRSNSIEWLSNQLMFFENFYLPFLERTKKEGSIFFGLGDWFDNRQLLDVNVMNKSIEIIYKISKIMPVYLLVGNHDIYKKIETDVNSLASFKFIPNVTIFEKPIIITNNTSNILVLPWIGNKEIEQQYININSKKAQYIFAHTDISGFKYDNGKPITRGINLEDLKSFKKIFSGHIHKRQQIDNLYYIGSPYHTKRGDIGNKKYVYIFKPDDNHITHEENTISSVFQRILLEDLLEWKLSYVKEVFANNYTDIVVPDKYIHLFNLTKFIELLQDCPYKKIETISEKNKISNEIDLVEFDNIKDIITLLEMSLEELKLPTETFEKLKQINKEYYNKASKTEIYA